MPKEDSSVDLQGLPAWIACEDLLVKMREELLSRAISLLHKEIDAGHINLEGSVLSSSEASSNLEESLYLINNLIDDSGRLQEEYSKYAESQKGKKLDDKTAKRFEDLKSFILSVQEMSLLMDYARELRLWADDASKQIKSNEPSEILKSTMNAQDNKRLEILSFFIKDKRLAEESLTEEELSILREASSN